MAFIKHAFTPMEQMFAAVAIFALVLSLVYGAFPLAHAQVVEEQIVTNVPVQTDSQGGDEEGDYEDNEDSEDEDDEDSECGERRSFSFDNNEGEHHDSNCDEDSEDEDDDSDDEEHHVTDVCPNLEGNQSVVPEGYELNSDDQCVTVEDPSSDVATIVAHKIVCTDEADLPNWGAEGGPDITSTTATDWVEEHSSCSLESGWDFEWVLDSEAVDPGDTLTGVAGLPWKTFGPTDVNGMTSVTLTESDLGDESKIWMREVLKDGYIPFTYESAPDNSDDVSAEFYCHTDAINYDNFEWIEGITQDHTYNCVAWNVPKVTDVCPNLEGDQSVVPEGYELNNDYQCVPVESGQCLIYSDETTLVDGNPSVLTWVHGWWATLSSGKWIWNSYFTTQPTTGETLTFTKTFNVTNTPAQATLTVLADNEYTALLNGNPLTCDGSGNVNYSSSDTCTAPVVSGVNTLTFTVTNEASDTESPTDNPGGLAYELAIDGSSCTSVPVEDTYTIDGYKWNDEDGDGYWDEGEPTLQGWTIKIEKDEDSSEPETHTATTDSEGHYSFEVGSGRWIVTEVNQSGWTQTAPEGKSCTFTLGTESVTEGRTVTCDFGNHKDEVKHHGGGGGGHRVSLDDDNGGDSSSRPDGEVLGESTSAIPLGAANTGAGGTAPQTAIPTAIAFVSMLMSFMIIRATRNA